LKKIPRSREEEKKKKTLLFFAKKKKKRKDVADIHHFSSKKKSSYGQKGKKERDPGSAGWEGRIVNLTLERRVRGAERLLEGGRKGRGRKKELSPQGKKKNCPSLAEKALKGEKGRGEFPKKEKALEMWGFGGEEGGKENSLFERKKKVIPK